MRIAACILFPLGLIYAVYVPTIPRVLFYIFLVGSVEAFIFLARSAVRGSSYNQRVR